jgi:sirohydrochlorin ferrochelatase
MAVNARGAAMKSLVLVFCLSSGLAVAEPKQLSHNVPDLWSQVEVIIHGPANWLRAVRELLARRSAEAAKPKP